jgi:hypothetical protein
VIPLFGWSINLKKNQTCCKIIENNKKMKDKSKRNCVLEERSKNKSHQTFCFTSSPPQPQQQQKQIFC